MRCATDLNAVLLDLQFLTNAPLMPSVGTINGAMLGFVLWVKTKAEQLANTILSVPTTKFAKIPCAFPADIPLGFPTTSCAVNRCLNKSRR
jgi:hypothetical protein